MAVTKLDNRISLQKLEVLCLVVELGTVARAAEHLAVAQPVVTAHIRSLEERLGIRLFVGSGRSLELTEAGQLVHSWAAETLARTHGLVRELQGIHDGQRGAALIGASQSVGGYLLPVVLSNFSRERPEADITMTIGDPETVLREVEQGDLDFCVIISGLAPDGRVFDSELLRTEDIVLVTAPCGAPLGDEIRIEQLAEIPIVGSPASARRSLVDSALASLNAPSYEPVIEFGHAEAAKRAVVTGLGATLLTRASVKTELELGVLREVRFRCGQPRVNIYAVKRRDKRHSELQQQLWCTIRDELLLSHREPALRALEPAV